VNPVAIPLDGNAGDAGVFEGLQGFDGFGKGLQQDLANVEQVATDQDGSSLEI
jgi:hypothetical protein